MLIWALTKTEWWPPNLAAALQPKCKAADRECIRSNNFVMLDTCFHRLRCLWLVPSTSAESRTRRCPAVQYWPGPGCQLSALGLTVSVAVSVCDIEHTSGGDYCTRARICTGSGRPTLRGRSLVRCEHGTKINVNTKQTDRIKKVILIQEI